MLISLSRKFIFISNSKTASSSLEAAMKPYAEISNRGSPQLKHSPWGKTAKEYASLFAMPEYGPATFFRFGVVRDPVDWFVSWYNYRFGGSAIPEEKRITLRQFWEMDDWVKWRGQGKRGGVQKKHLQKDHFLDEDGVCRFDLIIPMEKLSEWVPAIFSYLDIPEELPRKNVSTKLVEGKSAIDPDIVEAARDFWAEDYAFLEEARVLGEDVIARLVAAAPRARIAPSHQAELVGLGQRMMAEADIIRGGAGGESGSRKVGTKASGKPARNNVKRKKTMTDQKADMSAESAEAKKAARKARKAASGDKFAGKKGGKAAGKGLKAGNKAGKKAGANKGKSQPVVMKACPAVVKASARVFKGADGEQLVGVMVLAPTIKSEGWKLFGVSAGVEQEATWSLPSPKAAEKNPQNPNAAKARFKLVGSTAFKVSGAALKLVSPSGESWEVGQFVPPATDAAG